MLKKNVACIIMLAALAVIVFTAGCTGPAQENKTVLLGKDVFDPARFSMATYTVLLNGTQYAGTFTALGYPGESKGNRLTTTMVYGNDSQRMDVWLDRARDTIKNGTITVISSDDVQKVDMPAEFNMTSIDGTWNSPGSKYVYYGEDSAIVPAGKFANCSVYYGMKTIQGVDNASDVAVVYYMSPSVPVPVLYMVRSADSVVIYELDQAYASNDVDSSPERVVQSYFDRIGSGDYLKASRLLVNSDGTTLKPMNKDSIAQMEANMVKTYGKNGENMAIQYAIIDSITPLGSIDGHQAASVQWHSIQYDRTSGQPIGQVYSIAGTFNMVDDGGWKIIV